MWRQYVEYKSHPKTNPIQQIITNCNLFPFSDFRYSFTLFSKFFASFPHGTCSLSVSRHYLALEGIYLLLWAAVPSNSTLRKHTVRLNKKKIRDSHPLWCPLPRNLLFFSKLAMFLQTTTHFTKIKWFSSWALPSSLAVTRGILVSFFSSG